MNILLLTSEFAPAMGGIGTYAREIASAATRLGARVTVRGSGLRAAETAADDGSLPFEVVRFRGGLHSMRDLPSKILLARSKVRHATATTWSMPPTGRSSFRWRFPGGARRRAC